MSEQSLITTSAELPAVKLGLTKQAIGKLKKKFPIDQMPDAGTKEGMLEIKSVLRELVPYRTGIEKVRKELVSGAVAWQKKVNTEAKELTEQLLEIETPYKEAKQAEDERIAREKREKQEAEDKRIAEIEAKVEVIQNMTDGLLGAGLELLEARKFEIESMEITEEGYMEFVEPALLVKSQVLQQLENAIANAKVTAEQQAQLDEQRKELEKQQAQIREQQEALAAQQREQEQREAAEKAEIEEKERLDREQKEAEQREAELKARMPDDIKLRQYGQDLVNIKVPELKDQQLNAVLRDAYLAVKGINNTIESYTQDPAELEKAS